MNPDTRVPRPDRIQIGCDVHSVQNVRQSIEVFGSRYLDTVVTAREQRECGYSAERLAGRYAAKEAVLKALKVPADIPVPWSNIEIHADAVGAPIVTLSGPIEVFARTQGFGIIEVTLSHEAGVALAFAAAHTAAWDLEMTAA